MMVDLEVDGKVVRVSSLDRMMWPSVGMTKGQMIDYYARVAPVLLPYIAGHPVTLHRFPNGIGGQSFYQTRCPPHPAWIRTQRMHVFRSGKEVDAPVVDDVAGVVWAANLATVEFHPYLGRADALTEPLYLVFDLDPGEGAGIVDACEIALVLRAFLDELGLRSFAKTSGGEGMHVYVPVQGHPYEETKAFARALAGMITSKHRDRVVDRMTRSIRRGKVFIDWSQNDPGKSTVSPYSLRGLELPTVSAPVTWEEVQNAADGGDPSLLFLGPGEMLDRLETRGDLFEGMHEPPQRLPL